MSDECFRPLAFAFMILLASAIIAKHLLCGVVPGCAGHSTAGMRTRSAQIQSIYRRPILRPTRYRPHEKQLFEIQVAMKNVALGQPVGSFQVQRSDHLPCKDCAGYVGSEFGDLLHHTLRKQFAIFIPSSFCESVRYVLHETCHDVFSAWRKRFVHVGCHYAIHPEFLGDAAEFGDVITALRKFERSDQSLK
jgi:hypothetical protein